MAQPDDIYKDGSKVKSGRDYDVYGIELDWYVPVISSKDRGKKAGNLAFAGKIWYGQALNNASCLTLGYDAVTKPDGSIDEVEGWGGWTGLTYYITENVWTSIYYGYEAIDDKDYYPGSMVNDGQEVTANIFWKPARSILFGIEYAWIQNNYIDKDKYGNNDNDVNSIALVAYYFF